MQSPLPAQGNPFLVKHVPRAPQVVVAGGQESASSALITGEQVPTFVGWLQLLHISLLSHAVSQQTPSAQLPLWQLLAWPPGQFCPLAALTQLPAPSHTLLAGQVLGVVLSGWPLAMFPQVPGITPSAHDLQAGQLATPQQTPSTQMPVTHSEVAAQVCPLTFLQLPSPSHKLVPMQVLGAMLSGIPLAIGPQTPAPSAHD